MDPDFYTVSDHCPILVASRSHRPRTDAELHSPSVTTTWSKIDGKNADAPGGR